MFGLRLGGVGTSQMKMGRDGEEWGKGSREHSTFEL